MRDDFTQLYAILGLPDGSNWTTVRRAYRKAIQACHPDRFADGPDRQKAEKRTSDINAAYQALERYYDAHGITPSREAPASAAPAIRPTEPSTYEHPPAHAPPASDTADTPAPTRKTLSRAYVVIVLSCLALLLLYHGLETEPAVESIRDVPATRSPAPSTDVETHGISHFMVGSPPGRVYAVQGIPTLTTKDVWYYGKSKVYFQKGVVSHWENHPDNPLNAGISERGENAPLDFFTYGSTKTEVRAVQGQPWQESETMWEYGSSKVYFKGGQVSSWEESPYFPLKVSR